MVRNLSKRDDAQTGPLRVRRAGERDWKEIRALRLTALRSDPLAFGSTLTQEAEFDDPHWINRVARGARSSDEAIWVALESARGLVGMAGVYFDTGVYRIWGMWVAPRFRRRGVAAKLLDALLEWTSSRRPTAEVRLHVNPGQASAMALYLSRGFLSTGTTSPLPHTPGQTVVEMVRGGKE